MHSDLINKIEKAKRYAQQPERFSIDHIAVRFAGSGGDHLIELNHGEWSCDCNFFRSWQTCHHVMAVQKLLAPMLSDDARRPGGPEYVTEDMLQAAG
jgi:hypothetical protein